MSIEAICEWEYIPRMKGVGGFSEREWINVGTWAFMRTCENCPIISSILSTKATEITFQGNFPLSTITDFPEVQLILSLSHSIMTFEYIQEIQHWFGQMIDSIDGICDAALHFPNHYDVNDSRYTLGIRIHRDSRTRWHISLLLHPCINYGISTLLESSSNNLSILCEGNAGKWFWSNSSHGTFFHRYEYR